MRSQWERVRASASSSGENEQGLCPLCSLSTRPSRCCTPCGREEWAGPGQAGREVRVLLILALGSCLVQGLTVKTFLREGAASELGLQGTQGGAALGVCGEQG